MQSHPPFLRKRLLPPSASLLPQRSAASVAPPLLRGGATGLRPRVSSLKPAALFFDNSHLIDWAPARRAGGRVALCAGRRVPRAGIARSLEFRPDFSVADPREGSAPRCGPPLP